MNERMQEMPEYGMDAVSKEWLQSELRSPTKSLIVLDCRSSNEYQEGHIRSAVNFSIPSLILKRLATGKIDVTSTIKCRDLKQRIQSAYNDSLFVLYNDVMMTAKSNSEKDLINSSNATTTICAAAATTTSTKSATTNTASTATTSVESDLITNSSESNTNNSDATTINVLHRRLKQDGCHVYWLKDGFASFRQAFPEWCEDDTIAAAEGANAQGANHSESLMGLRSLRISIPYSDSVCSSSAESSDCEGLVYPQPDAPTEIIAGLFLGNASHSEDLKSLQRYNIKYILNVTPDLPNHFENQCEIKYLQIPITDHGSQDLSMYFPAAIKFIEEARVNDSSVLVHCLAGVSRSVTVTLAYLMHSRLLSFEEAFSLVRLRKPDISPNFHFLRQLHTFEQQLMDENPSRTPQSAQSSDSVYSDCCGCPLSSSSPVVLPFHQNRPNQSLQHFICQKHHYSQIGVSPDSGIEFDRWTSADSTPK